ncbi:DUF5610 domain-containing protein [Thalassospira xiamenensis]|jgi:hypothetical protein|uniref:DUF5610 domain-containing protein n=1 Tax=Thalassospira xiamenensis TaxID=220697 RepID=UPI000DEDF611|nr:DUF5610 domain-containing protein [Thalassospira xiamenensis]RCK40079.1 hypothetical protein TH24_12010 [Thalassospira xiamenensis]
MDITIGGLTSQAANGSSRSAQSYLPGNDDSKSGSNNSIASAFASATSVSLSSESGNLLSADQIVSAINESLSSTGLSIQGVDPTDYTPEAVADRILARVGDLIASNASSPEEAREIFDQASEGIAKGLEQARDFLDGLGALNDTINGNINETEDRLNEGLKSIEARLTELFESSPAKEAADTTPERDEQVLQSQITQTAQASQAYAEAGTNTQRNAPRYGTSAI